MNPMRFRATSTVVLALMLFCALNKACALQQSLEGETQTTRVDPQAQSRPCSPTDQTKPVNAPPANKAVKGLQKLQKILNRANGMPDPPPALAPEKSPDCPPTGEVTTQPTPPAASSSSGQTEKILGKGTGSIGSLSWYPNPDLKSAAYGSAYYVYTDNGKASHVRLMDTIDFNKQYTKVDEVGQHTEKPDGSVKFYYLEGDNFMVSVRKAASNYTVRSAADFAVLWNEDLKEVTGAK